MSLRLHVRLERLARDRRAADGRERRRPRAATPPGEQPACDHDDMTRMLILLAVRTAAEATGRSPAGQLHCSAPPLPLMTAVAFAFRQSPWYPPRPFMRASRVPSRHRGVAAGLAGCGATIANLNRRPDRSTTRRRSRSPAAITRMQDLRRRASLLELADAREHRILVARAGKPIDVGVGDWVKVTRRPRARGARRRRAWSTTWSPAECVSTTRAPLVPQPVLSLRGVTRAGDHVAAPMYGRSTSGTRDAAVGLLVGLEHARSARAAAPAPSRSACARARASPPAPGGSGCWRGAPGSRGSSSTS